MTAPHPLHPVFPGAGEMAARCRAFDWSATPLGPVEGWPVCLRTIVSTLLTSRHPMFLFWGPEHVQFYNDAYRPSLGGGGRHPRALGMRGDEFWTEIWDTIGPQIAQVMDGGEATWHEDQFLPIYRNDRLEDVYWTYSYSPVHAENGAVAGVLVVCTETTSRVQAFAERDRLIAAERAARAEAELFRHLLEHANDAHCLLNGEGRVLWGNRRMCERLGYTLDELRALRIWEVNPLYPPEGFTGVLEQARRGPLPPLEGIHQRKDGTTFPVEVTATLLELPEGPCLLSAVRDISERRQTEAERERLLHAERAARLDAEEANRAKSDFLAVMSHELRTPLNAIGGYAELMEMGIRGPVTEAQRADLSRIQASQRHLLGLINEVLNYARLETGSVRYEIADVPVREVLTAVEGLVEPQARARRLALHVHGCADGLAVRADPEKLRQILVNLLGNAVKFTDPGGRVELACGADGGRVHVSVRDTGIGIPADRLETIFEPFVQVRSDLTRTAEGVGLGLAISRDLARGMGGELRVQSVPGGGSTFTVTLPRA